MPAHAHASTQLWLRAGLLPISTVTAPGTHGAGITGMQGIGVSRPNAAAVAAATCGFATEVHMPKGIICFSGTESIMVAMGTPWHMTRFSGVMTSADGTVPKLQAHNAPAHTANAILIPPS